MDFKPTVCIYHADCLDGFTAAYQVWRRYKHEIRFIGGKYGTPPPYGQITDADDVIIVDFSYPEKDLLELARRSRRVLVLDHHASAERNLANLPSVVTPSAATAHQDFEIISGLAATPPGNLLVCFDMERSGAMMAWDFCWSGIEPTFLVRYVQDRDLWRFEMDETKGVHLYLTTLERTFQAWEKAEEAMEDPHSPVYTIGGNLLTYHNMLVSHVVQMTGQLVDFKMVSPKTGRLEVYPNVAVGAAPPLLVSDVGHQLLNRFPEADFAAICSIKAEAVDWSLRSENHRHDVSKVAEMFGGGGHRNAAGFRADG